MTDTHSVRESRTCCADVPQERNRDVLETMRAGAPCALDRVSPPRDGGRVCRCHDEDAEALRGPGNCPGRTAACEAASVLPRGPGTASQGARRRQGLAPPRPDHFPKPS